MKMLENGDFDMTSTVLKLFFYTFQDCMQLTSSRKECFLVFFTSILRSASGTLKLGKMRFRCSGINIFEDFYYHFRPNEDISMCSLLKYGKW